VPVKITRHPGLGPESIYVPLAHTGEKGKWIPGQARDDVTLFFLKIDKK